MEKKYCSNYWKEKNTVIATFGKYTNIYKIIVTKYNKHIYVHGCVCINKYVLPIHDIFIYQLYSFKLYNKTFYL